MLEIRCGGCHKLLGKGIYLHLAIICPRCKVMNQLRAASPEPECPGAPEKGSA